MILYFEVAVSVRMCRIPSEIRQGLCDGHRLFHRPSVEQTDWVKTFRLPGMAIKHKYYSKFVFNLTNYPREW